jgi:hypothetical protein
MGVPPCPLDGLNLEGLGAVRIYSSSPPHRPPGLSLARSLSGTPTRCGERAGLSRLSGMSDSKPTTAETALVTGGNRGLGLEVCR